MILLPIVILAIIQGITEFLPISSSGHLVLTHAALGDALSLNDLSEKRLDIAVHIGTLFAVILYFRKDFLSLIMGGLDLVRLNRSTINAQKTYLILISSIPVIVCGLGLFLFDPTVFDALHIMAWMTLIFGVVLYFADKIPEQTRTVEEYSLKEGIIIGLAQCLALIPGVSRSGITMTAGRFLGHSRIESARFSLLLGMVTISSAGALTGLSLIDDQSVTSEFLTMIVTGIIVSFLTAYAAILLMMKWLKNNSFMPFVIYRVVLGLLLLGLLYGGFIPENM